MSELSKLQKENKRLRALLKKAAGILDRYKELLQNPDQLGLKVKKKKTKKKAA